MRQQRVSQRGENSWLAPAEGIARNHVERGPGLGLVLIVPVRAVPAAAVGDFLRAQPEQEEVLLARLLGHLDGGAVARADGQCPVHHELHVAGAAGFVPGRRDLVGDVGGRDQPLGQRDAVFGEKNNL
jgi:hypothetical protein